jgi:DNA-binding beta-propeller fold protein YncE
MVLLLSVLLVFTPTKSEEQPRLLYATAVAGTKLVAFDLEAKGISVIGDTGFPFSLGLALCPPGGQNAQGDEDQQSGSAYTITNTFADAQLAKLNLRTGAATLAGSPLGQPLSIMAFTCSPDGTLYAIGQANPMDPAFNSLYTVSRETGLASRIGSTGISAGMGGFLMALAFAPDGTLYGASVSTLFRIDPSTGKTVKVVDFMGVSSVMGLAVDEDWNFYVADFVAQSRIYALDIRTGIATPILNTGLAFVHNIAFKTRLGE